MSDKSEKGSPKYNVRPEFLRTNEHFAENLDYLMTNVEFDFNAVVSNSHEKKMISQRSLATILGVSYNTLDGWRKKKSSITGKALRILSAGFHVDPTYLLEDHKNLFPISIDRTYWSVLSEIKSMKGIANITIYADPFLIYLCGESQKIDDMSSLSDEDKYRWYHKVKKTFDRPFLPDSQFVSMAYDSMLQNKHLYVASGTPYPKVDYDLFCQLFEHMQRFFTETQDYSFIKFKEWCDKNGIYCDASTFGEYYND